ncbi:MULTISPECIES: hypothetical protein [unclassified Microcoleus]|uniref:hypothetical protein n=1 Tax=unclassified Microcoleus TaxID=2642155 RepID=UPI0025F35BAF|nr:MULTISPECIES: hypothetical protein [unclassified Microcoleus]
MLAIKKLSFFYPIPRIDLWSNLSFFFLQNSQLQKILCLRAEDFLAKNTNHSLGEDKLVNREPHLLSENWVKNPVLSGRLFTIVKYNDKSISTNEYGRITTSDKM